MLIFELKSSKMIKSIFLSLALISFSFNIFSLTVNYSVKMESPNSHYFAVEMTISDLKLKTTEIKMPVWAPGSYLVREFAKSINQVTVLDASGNPIKAEKTEKNTWSIDTKGHRRIKVKYQVYAFELSVRTSFLDDSHGYINGSSVFMYVAGNKNISGELEIIPHASFKTISTALEKKSNRIYAYKNYDHLIDCPIEIGNHIEFSFDAAGVHHTVAMYGEGNFDVETLKRDMSKIIESETKVMGVNPNKNYLFIIHNLTVPSGGLEHVNSTTLQVNRWTYKGADYLGFLSLVAHEYFHLWNVKRMRPKELGPFDYDKENYTDLLWVMEGFTSYYDELILRRAGFYSEDDYLNKLFGTINYVENQPGNRVQPVAHASFDAWIKSYRPNENSVNTTISYYSKGQILAAMLDLYIIKKFDAKKSLDEFLQQLYQDFYVKLDVGFTEEEFQANLEKFIGEELDWFFDKYVYGTDIIDYAEFFKTVGLDIMDKTTSSSPSLGIRTSSSENGLVISTVYLNSAAEQQGLSVNDEIVAINGFRMNSETFAEFMESIEIGDEFEILLSRDNILKTYTIKMGESKRYQYGYEPNFTDKSIEHFQYWLRID